MHILNTIHGFAFYLRRTRIAVNAKVMKISIPRNPSMNKLPTASRTVATIFSTFVEGIVSHTVRDTVKDV